MLTNSVKIDMALAICFIFRFQSLNPSFMPNKNSTLTYRWMQEVWNNGREDAIDEMMDANVVTHGLDEIKEPGIEGFKQFFRNFKSQFPEIHVEVDDVVSQGDYETSRCLVNATNANGQKVQFTGMTCVCIQNGKITEGWNNFDFLSMYQQLGFRIEQGEGQTA
jgi:predicted ester cyclase